MADIDLSRAHDLGVERARALAEKMADDLGRKFGLRGDWDGDVLRFQRPGVDGTLAVTGKELRLTVTLGLLMKAMKASIERAVEQEIDGVFAKVERAGGGGARPAARSKKAPGRPKKAG